MGDTVRYEVVDHVATITYNRPERLNAINGEMRTDLNVTWERFRDDNDAWVAIVTGAGRAFCAGADLKDGAGSTGSFPASFWEIPTINSFESGLELFKPTIAAVNGPCIGYGLTGALACDFIIASDRASFSYPEVRLGQPTIVGAIRLPRRIAWADAMELLLTGERVDAARAEAMRLVWKVVEHDQLLVGGQRSGDAFVSERAARSSRDEGSRSPHSCDAVDRGGALWRDHAQGRQPDRRCRRGAQGGNEGRPPVWRRRCTTTSGRRRLTTVADGARW